MANLGNKEEPRCRTEKVESYIRRFVRDGGEPQFNIGPLLTMMRGVGDKNGLMPRSFRELRENLDICSRMLPEDPAPAVFEPSVDSDMRMPGRSEYRPKRFSNGSILKEMFQNLFAYWSACSVARVLANGRPTATSPSFRCARNLFRRPLYYGEHDAASIFDRYTV